MGALPEKIQNRHQAVFLCFIFSGSCCFPSKHKLSPAPAKAQYNPFKHLWVILSSSNRTGCYKTDMHSGLNQIFIPLFCF